MNYNTLINTIYWTIWSKLPTFRDEENGAEAIEWIALVAVLVLLIMGLWTVVGEQREAIAQQVVCGVKKWVHDAFGSTETASFSNPACGG
jgi:Flp pilus assembly pilin Flp